MAAVAHSPLLTTPINHLNSGSACCPTHAKDGRRPQCSARLEGRKALPGSFRSHRRPRWRWLGRQEGLRERASTPFQTDDHSCENGREEGMERTPKCMRGGVNFHFHPLTAACLRRRSFGMAEASGKTIPILASAQLPSHSAVGMPKVEERGREQ